MMMGCVEMTPYEVAMFLEMLLIVTMAPRTFVRDWEGLDVVSVD